MMRQVLFSRFAVFLLFVVGLLAGIAYNNGQTIERTLTELPYFLVPGLLWTLAVWFIKRRPRTIEAVGDEGVPAQHGDSFRHLQVLLGWVFFIGKIAQSVLFIGGSLLTVVLYVLALDSLHTFVAHVSYLLYAFSVCALGTFVVLSLVLRLIRFLFGTSDFVPYTLDATQESTSPLARRIRTTLLYLSRFDETLARPFRAWVHCLRHSRRVRRGHYAVVAFVLAIVSGVFLWNFTRPVDMSSADLRDDYTLIRSTIPADGPIVIRLPEGVRKFGARFNVTFVPEVRTYWGRTTSPDHIVFRLSEPLPDNDFFTVTYDDGQGTVIEQHVKAVERPRIQVFEPTDGSTVDEYTTLNFTFNQPMIPLQSLDRTYDAPLPITITPETDGDFVWTSQRQLEFIPTKRLTRSSQYTVVVGEGLTSVDGLVVPPTTYHFTVNPLRILNSTYQSPRVQDPLIFSFNQPIDLEALEVSVNDTPVTVSYASSVTYNPELEQKERVIDRSTIVVRPDTQAGRWEFDTKYHLAIRAIRPLEGALTVPDFSDTFQTKRLLLSSEVLSPAYSGVNASYFDTTGTLRLRFSEPIDKERSVISGKGIAKVVYQDLCRKNEVDCERVDRSVLDVTFDSAQFGYGETFNVSVDTIVAESGDELGRNVQTITLTTVPNLAISDAGPVKDADASQLYICSSNPLIEYDGSTYTDLISTQHELYRFYSTGPSYQVSVKEGLLVKHEPCEGEYRTDIHYSLLAGMTYDMTLNPTDVFGNTAQYTGIHITTAPWKQAERRVIKDPWFDNLHQQYAVTKPGRTKYTYVTGNLASVEVAMCKLSPADFIKTGGSLGRGDPGPTHCEERKVVHPVLQEDEGPNYFQIDLSEHFADVRGQYVISVTSPKLTFEHYENGKKMVSQFHDHMYTSVTNLSLVEKRTNQIDLTSAGVVERQTDLVGGEALSDLYWVTDHTTLAPISGAAVFVYHDTQSGEEERIEVATSGFTDEQGIARTKVTPDVVGAYVQRGADSAIVAGWADRLNSAEAAREVEQAYLYTDRPIYRPGDKVSFKGIHRIGYDTSFEIVPVDDLVVTLRDPRGQDLFTEHITLSAYGSFDSVLTLPEDASLGSYYLSVTTGKGETIGSDQFSVEEYSPAPFEVVLESEQEEYVAGDVLQVDVTAQHFFGAPVTSGEVSYTITSQDFYFDRSSDSRFRFGADWYRCYYCSPQDAFVARGSATLKSGHATIEELLDFTVLFQADDAATSKIFVVNATVRDGNGRSVSGQVSYIVHRAERYVAVRSSASFTAAGESSTVQVLSLDTTGAPTSETILLRVEKVGYEEFKRREVDGRFYTKSERTETTIFEELVRTDTNGLYDRPFVFPEAGEYIITASSTDRRGNPYSATLSQYVYGPQSAPVRRTNDRSLEIAVDNTDLAVDESGTLIVQSPYERAKALVTIERGRVMEYAIVEVNQNFFAYDVVGRASFAPNMVASVVLLSPEPEIKYGEVRFTVNRAQYELAISVESNKEAYLPGEEVTLSVYTTDVGGTPVPAEVSIAAVDLSVLALKGNPERDPLGFFYVGMPHNVITSSNLKFIHEEIEIPEGTKGGGGGEDLAKRERGVFRDTAFWVGAVETDQTGRATVRFTLPDNLTRWRVETIGVTTDTKLGIDYMEFEEKKDLITTPLIPRFVLPGDVLFVGAEVLNRTKVPQRVTFTVESDTLELLSQPQTITIPAEGAERLFVEARSPQHLSGGTHTVRLKAGNGLVEDALVKEIPIAENTLYETVFLSGYTQGSEARETFFTPTEIHTDIGDVTVEAYTTVGAYLKDSINYMLAYPYGCTEQLASKIGTLATARYLASLENIGKEYVLDTLSYQGREYSVDAVIDQALTRIYDAQTRDGGFAYYKRLDGDVALSLYIVSVLRELRRLGIEIDQRVLERADEYVLTQGDVRDNRDAVVDNAYRMSTLVTKVELLRALEPRPRAVDTAIQSIRSYVTRDSLRKADTQTLVRTALVSDELLWWDRFTVWREIKRRLRENTEGVYISRHPVSFAKSFYEQDITNTALLLRAIMMTGRHDGEAGEIVAWLLAQRSFDGAWGTTNATHEVVRALTEYIEWRDELHAQNVVHVLLDGAEKGVHDSTTQPRLEGLSTSFGYGALGEGVEHTFSFVQDETEGRNDTMYYDVAMKYFLDRDVTPARDEGVRVTREFFALEDVDYESPLSRATVGDTVVGRVSFTVGSPMRLMAFEDKIPAGFEIINFGYATENRTMLDAAIQAAREAKRALGIDVPAFMRTAEFGAMKEVDVFKDEKEAHPPSRRTYAHTFSGSFEELYDDRIFIFSEQLAPGTYVYEYYLRAMVPGTFEHLPVWIGELYNPAFFGRTESASFTVVR